MIRTVASPWLAVLRWLGRRPLLSMTGSPILPAAVLVARGQPMFTRRALVMARTALSAELALGKANVDWDTAVP